MTPAVTIRTEGATRRRPPLPPDQPPPPRLLPRPRRRPRPSRPRLPRRLPPLRPPLQSRRLRQPRPRSPPPNPCHRRLRPRRTRWNHRTMAAEAAATRCMPVFVCVSGWVGGFEVQRLRRTRRLPANDVWLDTCGCRVRRAGAFNRAVEAGGSLTFATAVVAGSLPSDSLAELRSGHLGCAAAGLFPAGSKFA